MLSGEYTRARDAMLALALAVCAALAIGLPGAAAYANQSRETTDSDDAQVVTLSAAKAKDELSDKDKKALLAKAKSFKKLCGEYDNEVRYFFADFDNDGASELFCYYHPKGNGSGHAAKILDYKGGKVKTIFNDGTYGLEKVTVYKKTKSMVWYCAGHGHESYDYFTMKGGKMKAVAFKGRMSVNGGWDRNEPWVYRLGKGSDVSKAEMTAAAKRLTKGTAVKYPISKWKTL